MNQLFSKVNDLIRNFRLLEYLINCASWLVIYGILIRFLQLESLQFSTSFPSHLKRNFSMHFMKLSQFWYFFIEQLIKVKYSHFVSSALCQFTLTILTLTPYALPLFSQEECLWSFPFKFSIKDQFPITFFTFPFIIASFLQQNPSKEASFPLRLLFLDFASVLKVFPWLLASWLSFKFVQHTSFSLESR